MVLTITYSAMRPKRRRRPSFIMTLQTTTHYTFDMPIFVILQYKCTYYYQTQTTHDIIIIINVTVCRVCVCVCVCDGLVCLILLYQQEVLRGYCKQKSPGKRGWSVCVWCVRILSWCECTISRARCTLQKSVA